MEASRMILFSGFRGDGASLSVALTTAEVKETPKAKCLGFSVPGLIGG